MAGVFSVDANAGTVPLVKPVSLDTGNRVDEFAPTCPAGSAVLPRFQKQCAKGGVALGVRGTLQWVACQHEGWGAVTVGAKPDEFEHKRESWLWTEFSE